MTEQDFWLELRSRIMQTNILQGYCDWMEPKTYYLDAPETIIEGKVGFLTNGGVEEFKFVLTLPKNYKNISEIVWNKMIPSENDCEWLYFNGENIELFIK